MVPSGEHMNASCTWKWYDLQTDAFASRFSETQQAVCDDTEYTSANITDWVCVPTCESILPYPYLPIGLTTFADQTYVQYFHADDESFLWVHSSVFSQRIS